MGSMTASDILETWEWGRSRHPIDRALAILATAMPEASHNDLIALPIGRRDTQLLRIRAETFGPVLDGHSRCASCDEQLEFEIGIDQILGEDVGGTGTTERAYMLDVDGTRYSFRLPNSSDLAAAVACGDAEAARGLIARRCLVDRYPDDGPIPSDHLTALSGEMARLDPHADITFRLDCPLCGHAGEASLDIVSFLWSEIDSAARRLVRDVHVLASAYGWSEADILAMSETRREAYIELAS